MAEMPENRLKSDDSSAGEDDTAWNRGRQAWPGVSAPRDGFDSAFRLCIDTHGAPPRFVEDLYLAVGCLAGDDTALRAFEQGYVVKTGAYVARLSLSRSDVAELEQMLRIRLLTGDSPKLASYLGAGPLASWLKVTATRLALDFLDSRRAGAALESHAEDVMLIAATDAPAGEGKVLGSLLTAEHRPLVREVMAEAFAALSEHEKTVLRMYLLDGVAVEAIAKLFAVHRATVARWLSTIRGHVLRFVNDRLELELGASASEVRSLFREFQFDVNVSLRRVLDVQPTGRPKDGPAS